MRALIRLTSALARVVPDRGILMYEKESMKYEESGKVVFERLVDMGRTDVRFILPRSMWHEVPPQYHRYLIDRHSFAHFFLFFNAKAIIGTTLPINAADSRTANRLIRLRLAKAKYKHVHLRHGVMYCVSLDSEQRKNLYSERGVAGSTAAKMVCSGELEARHFMDMAGFPRENLYICGVPKFDRAVLVTDPKLILIMPTWRPWEYNLVRTNPEAAPYYQMLLTLYNAVPAHLREHARIMPHPLMREPLQETALGKLMWQDSYDNALQHGAIMITDYSSISYDAFYRGTNVIFWWKDKNECMVKYGGRLMLTEDTAFGPVCYDPACLTETIERLYQAPQDPVYRERYSRIVEFSDNGNTDRLIEFMLRDGII